MSDNKSYISKVKLPNGGDTIYYVKDEEARTLISNLQSAGLTFKVSTDASTTPYNVQWTNGDTTVTGTLSPSQTTKVYVYLVPSDKNTTTGIDIYDEYVTVNKGTDASAVWAWERLGNTELDLDDLGTLATADSVTVPYEKLKVDSAKVTLKDLSGYTFTGTPNQEVSVSGSYTPTVYTGTQKYVTATATGTSIAVDASDAAITGLGTASTEEFVKSYPGVTAKLATTTVKSAGASVNIPNVTGNDTVTATKVVFNTDTTASKATAGTAVSVAKVGDSVSVYGVPSTTSAVITGASVTEELLTFSTVSVSSTTFTPAAANGTITPYTFSDVTVPVITSHEDVSATNVTLGTQIAVAGPGSDVTVATGSASTDATGGISVLTGLGEASKASGVTGYANPTTETFAKTVKVTAQPSIALNVADTTSTGAVQYVQAVAESTGTAQTINSTGTFTATGSINQSTTDVDYTVTVSTSTENKSATGTKTTA